MKAKGKKRSPIILRMNEAVADGAVPAACGVEGEPDGGGCREPMGVSKYSLIGLSKTGALQCYNLQMKDLCHPATLSCEKALTILNLCLFAKSSRRSQSLVAERAERSAQGPFFAAHQDGQDL